MTIKEQLEVVKAAAEGKRVEYQTESGGIATISADHQFDFDYYTYKIVNPTPPRIGVGTVLRHVKTQALFLVIFSGPHGITMGTAMGCEHLSWQDLAKWDRKLDYSTDGGITFKPYNYSL